VTISLYPTANTLVHNHLTTVGTAREPFCDPRERCGRVALHDALLTNT
jgi:hypothetical protein